VSAKLLILGDPLDLEEDLERIPDTGELVDFVVDEILEGLPLLLLPALLPELDIPLLLLLLLLPLTHFCWSIWCGFFEAGPLFTPGFRPV
jgi:hypothetical protein